MSAAAEIRNNIHLFTCEHLVTHQNLLQNTACSASAAAGSRTMFRQEQTPRGVSASERIVHTCGHRLITRTTVRFRCADGAKDSTCDNNGQCYAETCKNGKCFCDAGKCTPKAKVPLCNYGGFLLKCNHIIPGQIEYESADAAEADAQRKRAAMQAALCRRGYRTYCSQSQ